jgi:recombination protein RecA
MVKPYDFSKLRKSLTKNIDGLSLGFHDPKDWISTGSYALNYLISGDFYKGVPLGRVTMFAGQSGSGKSLIASGNLASNAQKAGCFVVMMDSENALDTDWLQALGVDTSDEKLLKIGVSMIDDVAKTLSEFLKGYRDENAENDYEDCPKVVIIIDSLGMLLSPTDVKQFEAGDLKGDLGRKPKALTALIRNTVNSIAPYPIGFIVTNHTYASQDMFNPDDKISGGQGFVYASSIVVAMRLLKLKEDDAGNKISDVRGIRAACKVMKSRFSKPFEAVQIKIPYESGMDAYSGLVDLFEKSGDFVKRGNKLVYTDSAGNEHSYFRKGWNADTFEVVLQDKVNGEAVSSINEELISDEIMED